MPPLDEKGFLGKEIEKWILKIRGAHSDFFQLADKVNQFCQKQMFKLEAHNKDKQETLVAALYIRVINTYQAAILLAERGLMSQSKTLTRSMIESLFSLCAIAKSEKYADEFILEDQRNRLRYVNKYRKLHGGIPPEVSRAEIESLEKQLHEDIKEHEIKKKTTEQWSIDAGMHDWYLAVYSVLSDSVHSKVKDLERHLVVNNSNEIKEFQWGPDDHDIEKILMTLIQGMLTGLKCTLSLFNQKRESEIAGFEEHLSKLVKERLLNN